MNDQGKHRLARVRVSAEVLRRLLSFPLTTDIIGARWVDEGQHGGPSVELVVESPDLKDIGPAGDVPLTEPAFQHRITALVDWGIQ